MNQWRKWSVVAVLALLLVGAVGAQAQTIPTLPTNSVTVNGIGQAYGTPDIAYVNLGVQTSNEDVVTAFNEANELMQQLIDALVEFGIERRDLQTTGLYMYTDTPFDPATGQPSETPVYRVTNSLSITVRNVDQVGEVISTGVNAGANQINGLTFGLEDPATLEQEARTTAVENARQRAQQLADLMGVTLGEPIIISETFSTAIPLFSNFDRAQSGGVGGAAPIEQGQLSVSVTVQVTFSVTPAAS